MNTDPTLRALWDRLRANETPLRSGLQSERRAGRVMLRCIKDLNGKFILAYTRIYSNIIWLYVICWRIISGWCCTFLYSKNQL